MTRKEAVMKTYRSTATTPELNRLVLRICRCKRVESRGGKPVLPLVRVVKLDAGYLVDASFKKLGHVISEIVYVHRLTQNRWRGVILLPNFRGIGDGVRLYTDAFRHLAVWTSGRSPSTASSLDFLI